MNALTATRTENPALGRVWPDDYPPVHVRSLVLRPAAENVGPARRFAAEYCASRGISAAASDDISLCLSEVFGNAVEHALFPAGRRHVFVQFRQNGPFVSGRVFDPDVRPECLAAVRSCLAGDGPVDVWSESGRGLALVVRPLSCRLSVAVGAHGLKHIEFVVDALPSKSI